MDDLFSFFNLHIFLYLSLFQCSSYAQQAYINNNQPSFNCSGNAATSKGYLCDIGHVKSCMSFVFFRSRIPYDTAITIGHLLGSEASEIASLNHMSSPADKIPANESILVPVSCTCSGNIYQHFAPYMVKKSDTYYKTATETYQGLTTCQAMISQNYYDPEDIPEGAVLMVPVRCACPTENQTDSGVASLLTYTADQDDVGVTSIGKRFGVDGQSILEANMLSQNSIIYAFTPILVPLKRESCSIYPELFFCKCTKGYLPDGNCSSSDKSFPTKLVMLLGTIYISLSNFKFISFRANSRYKLTRLITLNFQEFDKFCVCRCWHWDCVIVYVPFQLQVL